MANTVTIESPVKVITSGTVPDKTKLGKGQIAFGIVDGKKKLLGGNGTDVIDLSPAEAVVVVNNLTTNDATKALSAAQGKVLKAAVDVATSAAQGARQAADQAGSAAAAAQTAAEAAQTTADSASSMANATALEVTVLKGTLGSAYRSKGSKDTFADVQALTDAAVGDVWNVNAAFTLDGKKYPAGTNVVCTAAATTGENGTAAQWDALGGTFDTSSLENSITENRNDIAQLQSDVSGLTVTLSVAEI